MTDGLPDAVVGVVCRNGAFLIIQRAAHIPGGGYWGPPSGKVEPGESQAEAVARELLEETGPVVKPMCKVWECLSSSSIYRLHWWLAEYVSGELVPDPAEVSGIG
jgi:8-oxo-dGTP pyrophosphatase MutT (NUDIX family)